MNKVSVGTGARKTVRLFYSFDACADISVAKIVSRLYALKPVTDAGA